MAVTGWYPDPAGTAQLRFWDGQSWTTATASPPAAQPAFAPPAPPAAPQYVAQPGPQYTPQYSAKPGPPRGRRFWSVVAGVVVTGAVIAAAVPLVSGSHDAPTTPALQRVLLTTAEVGATSDGTFALQPPDSSGDSDNTSTDCQGTDLSKVAGPNAIRAEATQDYVDSSDGIFVSEDLTYAPGKAAALLNTLKPEAAACHSLNINGDKLAISLLPAPPVAGSDDTFAMQASGTISGTIVSFDIEIARFGDSIVAITYGGRGDPTDVSSSAAVVLTQAAEKAKPAF